MATIWRVLVVVKETQQSIGMGIVMADSILHSKRLMQEYMANKGTWSEYFECWAYPHVEALNPSGVIAYIEMEP